MYMSVFTNRQIIKIVHLTFITKQSIITSEKGGMFMKKRPSRVKVYFKDGTATYGIVDVDDPKEEIIIGGAPYDFHSLAATGATIAVNSSDILGYLTEHGISARPTGEQFRITISLSEDLRDRIKMAAKGEKITTTKLIVSAVEKYLEEKGA